MKEDAWRNVAIHAWRNAAIPTRLFIRPSTTDHYSQLHVKHRVWELCDATFSIQLNKNKTYFWTKNNSNFGIASFVRFKWYRLPCWQSSLHKKRINQKIRLKRNQLRWSTNIVVTSVVVHKPGPFFPTTTATPGCKADYHQIFKFACARDLFQVDDEMWDFSKPCVEFLQNEALISQVKRKEGWNSSADRKVGLARRVSSWKTQGAKYNK